MADAVEVFGTSELDQLKTWLKASKSSEAIRDVAPLLESFLKSYDRLTKNKSQQKLFLTELNKTLGFIKSSEKGRYDQKHRFGI